MADIFISYAREDREQVRPLAEAFKGAGWSVWWDTSLKPGEFWDEKIEKELNDARCVVVVWSKTSVTKRWVKNEARYGLNKRSLLPANIDDATLPLEFQDIQAEDLSKWNGNGAHGGLARLMGAVADVLHGRDADHPHPPTTQDAAGPSLSRRQERVKDDAREKPPSIETSPRGDPQSRAQDDKPSEPIEPRNDNSLSRRRERDEVRVESKPERVKQEPRLRQVDGVYIGADPRDLPDLAVFKDGDAPWLPEMVVIPKGEFMMGSPPGEEGRNDTEGPQHTVTIGYRFALGRYAVTFEQYDYFCDVRDHEGPHKPDDEGWGRGTRPVIDVGTFDAQYYCEWLSEETGHKYRLPSEAEWEYACRAGTTTPFSFGKTITTDQVNYVGHRIFARYPGYVGGSEESSRGQTVQVGSLPANPWGLHEIHGNVSEWCADDWHNGYQGAPSGGQRWIDKSKPYCVIRGGSWDDGAYCVRSAHRDRMNFVGGRDCRLGFRCARDIDA